MKLDLLPLKHSLLPKVLLCHKITKELRAVSYSSGAVSSVWFREVVVIGFWIG